LIAAGKYGARINPGLPSFLKVFSILPATPVAVLIPASPAFARPKTVNGSSPQSIGHTAAGEARNVCAGGARRCAAALRYGVASDATAISRSLPWFSRNHW
jgi:hypothetical protein